MKKAADGWRVLKEAMAAIERQFGGGSIMCLGEQPEMPEVSVISSGSIGIDLALGVGGFARGRIAEIYGPESSGKTTLALQVIAQAHKQGGICAFVDAEHALDVGYAQALGVDPKLLLISQPDSGEQALEIYETLARSGGVELLVLDSVAALVPRAEIDGDMGEAHMGLQARLISQAMRKLAGIGHRTGCVMLFINQLRQRIGVAFGTSEVTTGGNALKFYASMRLDVRRIGAIREGTQMTGSRTRIKVVKNKLAPPFREAEVDILYGRGIWAAGDLVDCALTSGVFARSGAWIAWQGRQLGQGRERVALLLEHDPDLFGQVRRAILDAAIADRTQSVALPAAG